MVACTDEGATDWSVYCTSHVIPRTLKSICVLQQCLLGGWSRYSREVLGAETLPGENSV